MERPCLRVMACWRAAAKRSVVVERVALEIHGEDKQHTKYDTTAVYAYAANGRTDLCIVHCRLYVYIRKIQIHYRTLPWLEQNLAQNLHQAQQQYSSSRRRLFVFSVVHNEKRRAECPTSSTSVPTDISSMIRTITDYVFLM